MYIDHLVEVCRELKRVLRKDGNFYLNLGDTYYGSGKGIWKGHEKESKEVYHLPPESKIKQTQKSNWLQPKQLLLIPSRVAVALQNELGLILRNDLIWHKVNHMPSSVKDRRANSYEHVFHFVKSRKYYYYLDAIRKPYKRDWSKSGGAISAKKNGSVGTGWYEKVLGHRRYKGVEKGASLNPQGKNPGDLIQVPRSWGVNSEGEYLGQATKNYSEAMAQNPSDVKRNIIEGFKNNPNRGKNPGDVLSLTTKPFKGAHFAVFPETLVEPLVKSSCPKRGVVFDPFCGSGTTLAVAKRLGRSFMGCDINPEYVEMSRKRVSEIPTPLEMLRLE